MCSEALDSPPLPLPYPSSPSSAPPPPPPPLLPPPPPPLLPSSLPISPSLSSSPFFSLPNYLGIYSFGTIFTVSIWPFTNYK